MIKGLAAWVLNNYLGKYVENLNTDQLSIALSQGLVELENLPLRKDALRQYGVPVEVRAGFVGKVKLQIPVRQLRSAPWLIVVEQLYVVAGPVRLSQSDEASEERAALDYKLSALDAMEAAWRAAGTDAGTGEGGGYYATSYTSWMSYGTGLVTNIVENLHLEIKDVHIRYEDSTTIPGSSFACGLTISSLTAESCDSDWLARFVAAETQATASHKLCRLASLAVYWDEMKEGETYGEMSLGELAVAMAQGTGSRRQLLAPVSAQARIRRNRSEQPLRSRTQPRVSCDLFLDQVALQLTDRQYGQMVGCVKGLQSLERSRRHRKWRPAATIHEDARAWWQYACGCLVRGLRPSSDWTSSLRLARENVAYVASYARHLSAGSGDTSTAVADVWSKAQREEMEVARHLEVVFALREVAMRRVRPPPSPPVAPLPVEAAAPTPAPARSMLLQWFPQWWGWHSSPDPVQDSAQGPAQLEEEILDALADTVENNTLMKRDVLFAQLSFTLQQGTVNLCSGDGDDSSPMLELEFEQMTHRLEYRPRTSSHLVHLSLGSVTARDRLNSATTFPVLVAPARHGPGATGAGGRLAGRRDKDGRPLFEVTYEVRPFNSKAHYRLELVTQSLDVVYNPACMDWLGDFFTRPLHAQADWQLREAARLRYETVKRRTKREILRNWERILQGHLSERKTWEIELDVSAPQIVFAEHFRDKSAAIVVVDFGKCHFTNKPGGFRPREPVKTVISQATDSDDEDAFVTPCSTPPGSEASGSDSDKEEVTVTAATPVLPESFTDLSLHDKLYDRYSIELSDMQVLVARARDNWRHAATRATSSHHALDRFTVSARCERRLAHTADPRYPTLALAGNLPRLVAHLGEMRAEMTRVVWEAVRGRRPAQRSMDVEIGSDDSPTTETANEEPYDPLEGGANNEMSRLLMLQFTVDQLALEVQSRGRSIAELQVSGVKATLTKRPYDTSASLSVHSLLLVDALQTFGPDFELLVASHKHVGMDSISGSLRDSEPTSPTSPGSPDPSQHPRLTSPMALTQALSSLQRDLTPQQRAVSPTWTIPSPPRSATSPPPPGLGFRPPTVEPLDAEALISVEVVFVSARCPSNEGEALQVATIQFNNLDIIANQETIVELMGFARRVLPQLQGFTPGAAMDVIPAEVPHNAPATRTEITFDFHRLNVLLLRAVVKDNTLLGRKIATATMTEARIQATIGSDVIVQGSLGGLQVLDVTPEGLRKHQRILSLGKDPLVECPTDLMSCLNAGLYNMSHSHPTEEKSAFSFTVKRTVDHAGLESADVNVRMASVWYVHSSRFLSELQSCAVEFKQYLANLARSIRSAATEMALGLVHARAEALAASLNMNGRRFGSVGDISTPRRSRRGSYCQSAGFNTPAYTSTPAYQATPTAYGAWHSPRDDEDDSDITVRLDIVLDTPVVVLPRTSTSDEVLVAHLGQISVNNELRPPGTEEDADEEWGTVKRERYNLEFREMNVYSLDTAGRAERPQPGFSRSGGPMRAEQLYSCTRDARPILHDTVLCLCVERGVAMYVDGDCDDPMETLQISGSVITPLKVSLTRHQYEQALESATTALSSHPTSASGPPASEAGERLEDIAEEGGVDARSLRLDQRIRSRMQAPLQQEEVEKRITIRVLFELPVFTVELRADLGSGEQGLVDLSFLDLIVQYDRSQRYETNVQVRDETSRAVIHLFYQKCGGVEPLFMAVCVI